MVDRYATARQEYRSLQGEFAELEKALEEANPGTVIRYQELYEKNGGEQFWPDPHKVKCINPTALHAAT